MSSNFSAVASISNGGGAFENKAQALTGKVTFDGSLVHAGVSAYDNYRSSSRTRDTRYAAYGTVRVGENATLIGEAGVGQAKNAAGESTWPRGFYVEGNYRMNRAVLFRAKYDYVDLNHDLPGFASERYTAETDLTLVPFMDVKLSLRRIVPEDAPDENQVLVQWHAYY